VLNAIDTEDNIFGLMGNHERSYLFPDERCSGFNAATAAHILHMDLSSLLDCVWVDNYLISHAGVSDALLENENLSLNEYLDAGNYTQVGYCRGGFDPIGGLYWCDWFKEFDPVVGVPQIVGHSGYRPPTQKGLGILQKGNSYNVDCLQHKDQVLLINEGVAEIIDL
jgi:hypothetical protein